MDLLQSLPLFIPLAIFMTIKKLCDDRIHHNCLVRPFKYQIFPFGYFVIDNSCSNNILERNATCGENSMLFAFH